MKQSIPEREKQVGELIEYFRSAPNGAEVAWSQIAAETGIAMTTLGRSLVRRALKKLKRPYAAVRGVGVTLSAPSNALTIMSSRFIRIDSAVRRADTTREQLAERHFDQLETRDQNRMLTLAGFFGAVRAFASDAKSKILQRPPIEIAAGK
jgi:hypothetical protein